MTLVCSMNLFDFKEFFALIKLRIDEKVGEI